MKFGLKFLKMKLVKVRNKVRTEFFTHKDTAWENYVRESKTRTVKKNLCNKIKFHWSIIVKLLIDISMNAYGSQ